MAPPPTRTATGARAPTREIGRVLDGNFSPAGMAPWRQWGQLDQDEQVPALQWPTSVKTYESMRNDTQLASLFTATILALRKMRWMIDPNGADDEMVSHISRDYNLPILGGKVDERKRGRAKRRFSFREHQRKAYYAGIYGFYYFEQVGYIGDGRNGRIDDGRWHLRKLAERPPRTIQDFRVADDGGLVSIIQNVSKGGLGQTMGQLPEIPVDNLVGYVWEQEGANWVGRSWFRECYKNWLIKDRLMRIDAVNHERAGGVPYIEAHPGATPAEIRELNLMAQGFRIGDTAGGAVPAGAKFNIAKGTNSSVVESIRYHDEAMARKFMLMVMQLGQTQTGSRALGTTFTDLWGGGLEAIAWWFVDTFNEFVIEDDIDWNWGEDVEQVPLLTFEYDPEIVVTDLTAAVTAGLIEVDDDLENALRKELGLTQKGTPRENKAINPVQPAATDKPAGASQVTAEVDAEGAPSRREASAVHKLLEAAMKLLKGEKE